MNRVLLSTVIAAGLLSGCVANPPLHDPAYAPAYPEPAVAQRPDPIDNGGSLYQAGQSMSLFHDLRAHRIGDILTVRLVEQTSAKKTASTSTSKEQSIDITPPTVLGRGITKGGNPIFDTSIDAERDFDGSGQSNQSNSLSGSITVTVVDVQPNGNLVVRGEKVVTLNQGDEFIRLSGIVRPVDVAPDNSIASTKVANARIIYGGRGAIHEANTMGWLARFFISAIMPF